MIYTCAYDVISHLFSSRARDSVYLKDHSEVFQQVKSHLVRFSGVDNSALCHPQMANQRLTHAHTPIYIPPNVSILHPHTYTQTYLSIHACTVYHVCFPEPSEHSSPPQKHWTMFYCSKMIQCVIQTLNETEMMKQTSDLISWVCMNVMGMGRL